MEGKGKFPLKMADGAAVRDPEELKEHFDLASVLRYYDNGKLALWLENYYYEDEARQVRELDPSDPDLKRKLCEILGIRSADVTKMDNRFTSITGMVNKVSMSKVREDNRRLNKLRKYTDDDAILDAVNQVAFTQEELESLLAKGVQEIYLCGERFTLPPEAGLGQFFHIGIYTTMPIQAGYITFIGVNRPTVDIAEKLERGYMHFKDVELTARAAFRLAEVSDDPTETFLRYQEAAEKGLAEAQERLGHCYKYGKLVEKDLDKAVLWSRKAAVQGNAHAQTRMGVFYQRGDGVEKNLQEAAAWYQKAAEQGYDMAQYYLGCCYRDGSGVVQDEKKAIEWLKKAHDQGVRYAGKALIKLAPSLFRLSEVVLCAAGGKENIDRAQLDTATNTIGISVQDRHKIDETVLKRYGATAIQTQPIYYEYTKKAISPKKALGVAARAYFGLWAYDIGKAVLEGRLLLDVQTDKVVRDDLGWGFLRFHLETITQEMLEDFNLHVKKDPDTPE